MFLVGLTGGISTGKSTVAKTFATLGCPVIDADIIAREVVEPGTQGWCKIREVFGAEVLMEDGQLDREKLGRIIFADKEKRMILNKVIHPEIHKKMIWKLVLLMAKGYHFVVLDIPLLFESRLDRFMSYIIVVSCQPEQQLERLRARNNLSKVDAEQKINVQIPLKEKCLRATHIIDNSGDLSSTEQQVKAIFLQLCDSKQHWKLRITILSIVAIFASLLCYYFIK